MSLIERTIRVEFEHRVFFTEDAFGPDNPLLGSLLTQSAAPRKVLVVLDGGLARAQPLLADSMTRYFAKFEALDLVYPPLVMPGGEEAKNSLKSVSQLHAWVEQFHLDRHSFLIGVGGGALLDLVGFAAATAHRGVRHLRLPSTTLSQNDAGVGIKNGINAFGKKNFIGTFAPPFAVLNDFQLLATLPEREWRAGTAEAVKVALVRDRCFFEWLEEQADALAGFAPEATRRMIRRCAELHIDHLAHGGDPFELGAARPMDFGHWSAHKLEQLSNLRLRHGEAVAIGIALDTIYSRKVGSLDAASAERVLSLLRRLGLELFCEELLWREADQFRILQGIEEFREHLGGELTITLLAGLGQGIEAHALSNATLSEAILELKQRHEQKS